MKSRFFVLAFLGIAAPAAPGATFIVVNRGEYKTAKQAGNDEANVKWDDGNDADDIICTENFAALELQRYLRKMAGQAGQNDYEIVDDYQVPSTGQLLLIGNQRTNKAIKLPTTDFEGLGPEGYIVRSLKDATHIGGQGRIGTLYGVYRYLDWLGVRWLSPGEIGEEVSQPTAARPTPPPDIREKPAFVTRGFHAWEDRGDPDFFDWMVRNRMNYWCVQVPDKAALKKRGIQMSCGGHVLMHRFISPTAAYPYNHGGFAGDDDRPADPYPVSPDFQGDADKDGKLSYSEAHP